MKLTRNERDFLATLVTVGQKMLGSSSRPIRSAGSGTRKRRSSADVTLLKKQIRSARRQGVPVSRIAKELGVTSSYIYQLKK